MRNFPILFLYPFGPTPETTLPDGSQFICRKIFVHVKAVGPNLINDESHFVLVTGNRCASIDFRRKICRRNLALSYSHVAHLWPVEAYAVTNCVYPLQTANTHCRINV